MSASKHYDYYPDGEFTPLLAYGFRPFLFVLPIFIVLNICLWTAFWIGIIPLGISDPIAWHMHELIFGVGSASLAAFFLTAVPELLRGQVPFVGKPLLGLVSLWIAARASFWLIDLTGVLLSAALNLSFLLWLGFIVKGAILDKRQRHSSLGYMLISLLLTQGLFFANLLGVFEYFSARGLMIFGLHLFLALIVLSFKRVYTEAINEWLETKGIDDVFKPIPVRFNLAFFMIICFALAELFSLPTSTLAWLSMAAGSASLGLLSTLRMKDSNIILEPFVMYLYTPIIFMGLGYFGLGFAFLLELNTSDFLHVLTIGAFSQTLYVVFIVIAFIHTGRKLQANIWILLGLILLSLSAILRLVPFYYPQNLFYALSGVFYCASFVIYWCKFNKFLRSKRADGVPG